jgi:lysine 6-dehydrogenase
MKRIVVLGAGMVGRAIAADLSDKFDITSVDFSDENLNLLKSNYENITTIKSDFRNFGKIREIVRDFDFVVGAVPGFLGYETLKNVILEKKNVVDISFFPEDAFELDELAKENGVTAVVDMGVAPGMSNFLLGYHSKRMQVENFICYVGGLPFERTMPFQYKAPFSPIDVLEEYTRTARFVVNGKMVCKEPLTDSEFINIEGIGTLEAFNSDGLRSLIKTINAPNMIEKTLRYPGHIDLIKAFKAAGFFSEETININGTEIKPIEFTSKILFDKWKLLPGEDEFTVMKIIVEGIEEGNQKVYDYYLFDALDPATGFSSMARTTGFACTSVVNLMNDGLFSKPGINPPEFVAETEEAYNYVLSYLSARNIFYLKK